MITSAFKAEKTLTKDTVPVDVDAVLFRKVVDPKKAALDVADYEPRRLMRIARTAMISGSGLKFARRFR